MNTINWQSQAPANTMIMGEHSVVYGQPALACALDQFITINWRARTDTKICIHSDLAQHSTDLTTLSVHPQLTFVCHALRAFHTKLPHGLDIKIISGFSSTIGLGSSAAVLAAMLSGLNTITRQTRTLSELFEIGHRIIIEIQGRGSGTDLAASLSGGILFFEPKSADRLTARMTQLPLNLPIILIYAGYKTPTAEVLAWVAQQWQGRPTQLTALYQTMAQTTQQAFNALKAQDLNSFYQACTIYQTLMNQLGVNDKTLDKLTKTLNNCPTIHAAKISGSGLGDCVLAIGSLANCPPLAKKNLNPYQMLAVNITLQGANTKICTKQAPLESQENPAQ